MHQKNAFTIGEIVSPCFCGHDHVVARDRRVWGKSALGEEGLAEGKVSSRSNYATGYDSIGGGFRWTGLQTPSNRKACLTVADHVGQLSMHLTIMGSLFALIATYGSLL